MAGAVLFATACGGGSSESASRCSGEAEAVMWGGVQWVELSKALAAQHTDCVQYYVSVPPQDSDKTALRPRKTFKQVRSLDSHIHPVAEIRFTSDTGWREWVLADPDRTFYAAGAEARRRMAEAGLDVTRGETWALNELDDDVREGVPGRREEISEFLRGLYEGGDLPDARGIVFNIGVFSDQRDVSDFKSTLQEWLADGEFWSDLDKYVDYFADEVYVNPITWGVAGSSLDERTDSMNDFLYHLPALAQAGPEEAEAARRFLQRTYVPLGNAAWPHPGIGQTDQIDAETMSRFVAAQVYAMRRYASAHEGDVPSMLGFGWAPVEADPHYSDSGRDMYLERLAKAVRDSQGGADAALKACGSDENGCLGDVDRAFFNDVWKTFASWD